MVNPSSDSRARAPGAARCTLGCVLALGTIAGCTASNPDFLDVVQGGTAPLDFSIPPRQDGAGLPLPDMTSVADLSTRIDASSTPDLALPASITFLAANATW